ncbi:hypothetical protein Srot_2116 [Segniliparus rotundus DSM 44985]|uniref:Uncharacterized protein n=1 Tax=Segniliparus rotundus (strain ATCC BAA-972 / CDC 1076 / CIP 108378 / DSM 44985 / JCM 13578) TaxID=640132 RepID=D6Z9E0_SEGRD|nr:hypothetical protein Srot_2116 [Segniliparus rotundus DSM 44985]
MTLPSTRPGAATDIDAPSAEELRRRVKQLSKEHREVLARMPRRIRIYMQCDLSTVFRTVMPRSR